MTLSIIILAAGKGTRMKSELPKVMHKVAGVEMINMVIGEAKTLNPKNITIVVSDEMKPFEKKITSKHPEIKISFIVQKERKGTAHAVQVAVNEIQDLGDKVLVLYGDTPLTRRETLEKMSEKLNDFSLCVLAFDDFEENAYGRLVIDQNGHLERIVEFKDADSEERKISLCNSGVVAIDGKKIKDMLAQVKNENAAKEFYLTDIVGIAGNMGLKRSFLKTEMLEVLGVNSRLELARIEEIKQNQIRKKMMENGVTLIDPNSVYFALDTKISNDTIIHPNVVFGDGVIIDSNVEIKSFSHIEGAKIASGSVIGPFARLRHGSDLAEDVKIGNFVEVKKSQIRRGAKVSHLSYIGDAEIGEESNIGAGTITCNYDGYNKFQTTIGANVFVGSNSALVAPVNIGDNSVIAAGSVITKDVIQNDLAVARAKQTNIENGGKKFHDTRKK
jgi:bifunctional UDP-N-acetylglucosamine pyrophosphorylase/glucosamine-1-phosphate N-acetyltransferase